MRVVVGKKRWPLVLLGISALVVALYCFSGYAMNASFSGSAPGVASYGRRAVAWGIAALFSLIVALGAFVTAWRRKPVGKG